MTNPSRREQAEQVYEKLQACDEQGYSPSESESIAAIEAALEQVVKQASEPCREALERLIDAASRVRSWLPHFHGMGANIAIEDRGRLDAALGKAHAALSTTGERVLVDEKHTVIVTRGAVGYIVTDVPGTKHGDPVRVRVTAAKEEGR